ncbi:MAG: hypothetical protein QE271_12435 [Bacteriovoracaceae bacterium]|nr:hypothetical protein [Bacteriovoracaceae bacterium]
MKKFFFVSVFLSFFLSLANAEVPCPSVCVNHLNTQLNFCNSLDSEPFEGFAPSMTCNLVAKDLFYRCLTGCFYGNGKPVILDLPAFFIRKNIK